jgi:hypothetical protein
VLTGVEVVPFLDDDSQAGDDSGNRRVMKLRMIRHKSRRLHGGGTIDTMFSTIIGALIWVIDSPVPLRQCFFLNFLATSINMTLVAGGKGTSFNLSIVSII